MATHIDKENFMETTQDLEVIPLYRLSIWLSISKIFWFSTLIIYLWDLFTVKFLNAIVSQFLERLNETIIKVLEISVNKP